MGQTPQQKKAIDMRSTGMSLREIAEKLNIQRRQVEVLLEVGITATKEEEKVEEEVEGEEAEETEDGKETADKTSSETKEDKDKQESKR